MRKFLVILAVFLLASTVYAQSPASGVLSVHFPPNSADLRAVSTDQAIANLLAFTQIAKLLADNPQTRVLIDGHANAVLGTETEEMEMLRPLSQQRAEAAASFIIEYFHIDQHRLIISAAGGAYPVSTRDGSLNRRVSFTIIRN